MSLSKGSKEMRGSLWGVEGGQGRGYQDSQCQGSKAGPSLAGEEGSWLGRREPGLGGQSGQDQRMSSRDRGDRVSSIMGSG